MNEIFDKDECAGCVYAGRPNKNLAQSGAIEGCLADIKKCRTIIKAREFQNEKGKWETGYDLVLVPRNVVTRCQFCNEKTNGQTIESIKVCDAEECLQKGDKEAKRLKKKAKMEGRA